MTEEEGAAPPRETGWRGPLLAGLLLLIFPALPPLGVLWPVDQPLILVAPALAVCALVGWRTGGRLQLAILWSVLALWALWLPANAGTYAMLMRGWGALLAAAFGAVLLAGWGERMLPRALMAIAIALGVGSLVLLLSGNGFGEIGTIVSGEVGRRTLLAEAGLREFLSQPQWQEMARENEAAARFGEALQAQFATLPSAARTLVLGMLAVESLAVLAFTWAVYHRVGRVRLGPPLAPLREFRFDDALVWGFIAGLVTLVLPGPGVIRTVGQNLLVFFGVLYALRGLGVVLWFLSPGRWMMVFLTFLLALFLQVVGVMAVVVGLGDTWLDWRRRPRPTTQRSE